MNSYISIGFQCYSHMIAGKLNVRKGSLPYDYILSNPKFIYDSLYSLLVDNCDIETYVKSTFLNISSKGACASTENYYDDPNGKSLINSKSHIIFAHEPASLEDIIPKYVRRFNRLKDLLSEKDANITLIYGSPISKDHIDFTINGTSIIKDTGFYLNKIAELMQGRNKRFRILVFNSYEQIDLNTLHKDVILFNIPSFGHWSNTLDHIVENYRDIILDTH